MPYRIAGIDVHKKMLAVVVADVEIDGDFHFERQKAGTSPSDLRGLAAWLVAQEVEEVVMIELPVAPSNSPAWSEEIFDPGLSLPEGRSVGLG